MSINATLNILLAFLSHKQYFFTSIPEVASGKKKEIKKINSHPAVNQQKCGRFCNMLLGIIRNLVLIVKLSLFQILKENTAFYCLVARTGFHV